MKKLDLGDLLSHKPFLVVFSVHSNTCWYLKCTTQLSWYIYFKHFYDFLLEVSNFLSRVSFNYFNHFYLQISLDNLCQNWFGDQLNGKFLTNALCAANHLLSHKQLSCKSVIPYVKVCWGVVFNTAFPWFLVWSRVACYHPLYNVFRKIFCTCFNSTWDVTWILSTDDKLLLCQQVARHAWFMLFCFHC